MVPSKTCAVILGEPICWRCSATDLSRKERGKVVPSKIVRRSALRTRFPWLPLGERARPGGMRKSGSFEKSMAPLVGAWLLDLGRNSGNEEKWFRHENVLGTLFVAELEGLPTSP